MMQAFEKAKPLRKKQKITNKKTFASDMENIEDMDEDQRLKEYNDYVDSWYSDFNEALQRALNYLNFLYVDGWEPNVRSTRERQRKPTLEFNKIVPIIRAMMGEQRNNSPQLTVRALDQQISQDQVDWRNGLLRYIAYKSESDVAYQTAFKSQLECGWGAIEVTIEYEDSNSLKQCIKINTINDYQVCFWDPAAQKTDRSDGDFCGKYWRMKRKDFKRTYPNVENPISVGNVYFFDTAQQEDMITLCDLYYKVWFKKTLVRLNDNREMELKEAKKLLKAQEEFLEGMTDEQIDDLWIHGMEPLEIVEQSEIMDFKITKVRFVQNKILEETPWPGKLLNIVYAEGDSVVIRGRIIPIPMVQGVVDTQRLINLYGSEIAYSIIRARKEQYFITKDQVKGQEEVWQNADNVQGALIYNDTKTNSPPIPITAPAFNPALLEAQNASTSDISQIMGRYEEARGEQSNAISGVAINNRQRASNLPTNVYIDNLQRAIAQTGKIIMELVPHVYKEERDIVVRDPAGESKSITINKRSGRFKFADGDFEEIIDNPVNVGKFDIEVRVDGSYDAQRLEALEMLLKFAQIYPPMAPLLPDLIAENSGLESAQKLIERAKTLLPPNIKAQEEGKPPPPPQPDPMQQLEQQKMQLEQKKIEAEIQSTQQKTQAEMMNIQQRQQQAQTDARLKEQQQVLDSIKLQNERIATLIEAKLGGINERVAIEEAQASIVNTRIKAAAEVHKSALNKQTAEITHHTKRMTEAAKLIPKPENKEAKNERRTATRKPRNNGSGGLERRSE